MRLDEPSSRIAEKVVDQKELRQGLLNSGVQTKDPFGRTSITRVLIPLKLTSYGENLMVHPTSPCVTDIYQNTL